MKFIHSTVHMERREFTSAPIGSVFFKIQSPAGFRVDVTFCLSDAAGSQVLQRSVYCQRAAEYSVVRIGTLNINIVGEYLIDIQPSSPGIRRIRTRK